MFEGLYLYEIILMVCGAMLFMVLLACLVPRLKGGHSATSFVPLFLIVVVMIGYPGIQRIKYEDGVLSIEKLADAVEQDPDNEELRTELNQQLARVESRAKASPAGADSGRLVAMANANRVLGRPREAKALVTEAKTKDPDVRLPRELRRFDRPPPVP